MKSLMFLISTIYFFIAIIIMVMLFFAFGADLIFRKFLEPKPEIDEKVANNKSFDSKLKSTSEFILYHENGILKAQIFRDNNNEYHGEYKEWYDDGTPKSVINFNHGVMHGSCVTYHSNGKLFQNFNFLNGKKDGVCEEFYENGNKNISGNFYEGDLHGLKEQYYMNGKLEAIFIYENGKMEGVQVSLDENGEILEKKIMQNGWDITYELELLMLENECYHLQKVDKVDFITNANHPQQLNDLELYQKMYDYYIENNLRVSPLIINRIENLHNEGKIDDFAYMVLKSMVEPELIDRIENLHNEGKTDNFAYKVLKSMVEPELIDLEKSKIGPILIDKYKSINAFDPLMVINEHKLKAVLASLLAVTIVYKLKDVPPLVHQAFGEAFYKYKKTYGISIDDSYLADFLDSDWGSYIKDIPKWSDKEKSELLADMIFISIVDKDSIIYKLYLTYTCAREWGLNTNEDIFINNAMKWILLLKPENNKNIEQEFKKFVERVDDVGLEAAKDEYFRKRNEI